MKQKVKRKQHNSKMCLVCGLKNEFGLKASFYEIENGELVGIYKPKDQHQGYPGRVHGGIIGAILDETIGRAINILDDNIWGVTVELNLQYKKPVPLNEELRVVGRITKNSSRLFEGTGEILLENGEIAATGVGKYLKIPIEKITNINENDPEWDVIQSQNDPVEIEL